MPQLDETTFGINNDEAVLIRRIFQYWFDRNSGNTGLSVAADDLYQKLGMFAVEPPRLQYRCPTTSQNIEVDPSRWVMDANDGGEILGCGSWDTSDMDREGLVDCSECGIWFNPAKEKGIESRPWRQE